MDQTLDSWEDAVTRSPSPDEEELCEDLVGGEETAERVRGLAAAIVEHCKSPRYSMLLENVLAQLAAPLSSGEIRRLAAGLEKLAAAKTATEKIKGTKPEKYKAPKKGKPALGEIGKSTRAYTEALDDDYDFM